MEDIILVLKKESLDKLEVNLYKNLKLEESMCSICSDEFNDEDIARVLPCNHVFHRVCIDPWLTRKSYKCPICRKECGDRRIYN